MADYEASVWIAGGGALDEAVDILTGMLAENESVKSATVSARYDEDNASNKWISVSFDWDPEASRRVGDDHVLDQLTASATAAGIVSTLAAAGIPVDEVFDEYR